MAWSSLLKVPYLDSVSCNRLEKSAIGYQVSFIDFRKTSLISESYASIAILTGALMLWRANIVFFEIISLTMENAFSRCHPN